jgi:AraC family transcriptional regulator of adaptative response / DNA-3-methyladenine glycosylase II
LADGDVVLDAGAPRDDVEARLRRLPGIGPWTASYIVMRALGHPDVYLPTDAGVRQAMERLGGPTEPHAIAAHAERWRPWRSYALLHTWAAIPAIPTEPSRKGQR